LIIDSFYVQLQKINFFQQKWPEREPGWQSGKELDFYPSNLGIYHEKRKRSSKTAQCVFHDLESQGVLKKISKTLNGFYYLNNWWDYWLAVYDVAQP